MKIAYLISTFTDPDHLSRLLKALEDKDVHFFIHVDAKTDIRPFEGCCQSGNIHFLSDRVNVYWGTYSQVEFQMRLIRAALDSSVQFDRLFMLSGQDYPLWSNVQIRNYLNQSCDRELISGICLDTEDVEESKKRIYRLFRPQTNIGWLSAKANDWLSKALRKFCKLTGLRKKLWLDVEGKLWHLYKGSDYFCLSHDLAAYVVHTWETQCSIQQYFKTSFAPSETCIQTIVFNNPAYAAAADLHTGDYTTLKSLTFLHHIDYVPLIRIWKDKDYDELMNSGKMFARKFTTTDSTTLLDRIDQHRG